MGGPGSGRTLCEIGCTCGKHTMLRLGSKACLPGCCICIKHDKDHREKIARRVTDHWRSLTPTQRLARADAISKGDPRNEMSGRLGWTGGEVGSVFAALLQPIGYVREFQVNYDIGISSHYKLDFALPSTRINIELDGPYHDSRDNHIRDSRLRSLGWKVIRIRHD